MEELRGLVLTTTGWSSDVFDDTPMEVVTGLLRYWEDCPPVHLIEAVKAGLGKPKQKKPKWEELEKVGTTIGKGLSQPKKPEPMTEEDWAVERALPELVQKIRAEKRKAREEAWQTTQLKSE